VRGEFGDQSLICGRPGFYLMKTLLLNRQIRSRWIVTRERRLRKSAPSTVMPSPLNCRMTDRGGAHGWVMGDLGYKIKKPRISEVFVLVQQLRLTGNAFYAGTGRRAQGPSEQSMLVLALPGFQSLQVGCQYRIRPRHSQNILASKQPSTMSSRLTGC
jgi:hypothetical protein